MSLRILVLVMVAIGLAVVVGALRGVAPPTAAPATIAPPVAQSVPGVTPVATATIGPVPTPPPAKPYGVPVPVATRTAPLTDSEILADVQERVLSKVTAVAGKPAPAVVTLAGAGTRAATVTGGVSRFAPNTLSAVSPDTQGLNLRKDVELAVVVVRCSCDPSPVVVKGPRSGTVDYLVLVYDPRYSAPVNTIWAPESDLVQALTGNRAVPTATLAATQTAGQRATLLTPVASGATPSTGLVPMH